LGFLCIGYNAILGSFREVFWWSLIYIESGTVFPRGGRNFGVDLLMRGIQASSSARDLLYLASTLQIYLYRGFGLLLVSNRRRAEIIGPSVIQEGASQIRELCI
jgi:hypothetical protein